MKKTLSTIVVAATVVLLTATFGFAQLTAAGTEQFPILPTRLPDHRRTDHRIPEK